MNIYGQEIELTDPDGDYVTDVIVLARTVHHDSSGRLQDRILISRTADTTGMIQRGMLLEAENAFIDNLEDDS